MSPTAVRRARSSSRSEIQNLAWAAGYNIVAIPLAAGALAWAGIVLAPAVGGILMSVSTVVVALNAQLIRRLDLRPSGADLPAKVATEETAVVAGGGAVATCDLSRRVWPVEEPGEN
jgi:hypothetical protein